jgi:hypothetical protein
MPLTARRVTLKIVLLATSLVVLAAVFPLVAQANFQIGMQDTSLNGPGTDAATAPSYQTLQSMGASFVRVSVPWALIAGSTPFDMSNPSAPQFRWTSTDKAVRRAAAHHLQVLFMLYYAPTWAEGPGIPPATDLNVGKGAWEPNAALYGQFVHAVAERYSGDFPDPLHPGLALPRVKDYELWNEENLGGYVAGPDTPGQFRALVNAGYSAIKSVHSDNFAVLGGIAPIAPPGIYSRHPVPFTQQLLCLRPLRHGYARIKGCPQVHFDAFAIHPYVLAATPTKPAYNKLDFLVPDTGKITKILRAAERLHTVNRGPHPMWNTEWAWFTNPPQAVYGDPPLTAARYVDYSMYLFWKNGISLVIWQTLADITAGPNPGGGLETAAGVPKPDMTAFSFPFIASVGRHHKGYGWGKAPVRQKVTVFVSHLVKGKWHRVAKARTDGYGVFQVHFKARGNGTYRAQVAKGGYSLPYYSAKIPPKRTHDYTYG